MLFNSFEFLFAFLPISIIGYYWLARYNPRLSMFWLVLMSFVFYGWWNALFVSLLAVSVLFNYSVGFLLHSRNARAQAWILGVAIVANLTLLFYYKYFAFALTTLDRVGIHLNVDTSDIILPLGISFFTFTQLGYLIDCKAGIAKGRNIIDYALFVTFFPHLLAGPILHHREMMPQFADPETRKFKLENFTVGISLFVVGLVKKVVIADQLAHMSRWGFDNGNGSTLGLIPMWVAVLAYSLQLYFDFSGYSDMAAGQAKLFGVRFPANFNSPYKATSIIAFWDRWHMTLTRYLTLYLYNPISLWITRRRAAAGLPIGRPGASTLHGFALLVGLPTFVTIVLAGVWHGAGMTFVIFGVLHGAYLTINHAWRIFGPRGTPLGLPSWVYLALCGVLTYLSVLVAQVFFRAPSVGVAIDILGGLIGLRGHWYGALNVADLWRVEQVADALLSPKAAVLLLGGYLLVLLAPNSLELFSKYSPVIGHVRTAVSDRFLWHPTVTWGAFIGVLAALSLLYMTGATEFLYFQF